LVLHIGFLKTGSTYLQQQFGAARNDIMMDGVLFPTTGIGIGVPAGPRAGKTSGHSAFAKMIGKQDWRRMAYLLPLLAQESNKQGCCNILVSAENISYRRTPEQNRLFRYLMDCFHSVEVVIYLRRWDDWIESLYKERLDFGETRTFEEFRSAESWQTDYITRLGSWERACSDANARLRVFDYDVARQADGGLLAQFFHAVFPDVPAPIVRTTVRANPSYNAAQTEALRRFNLDTAPKDRRGMEALDRFLIGPFASLEGEKTLFTPAERSTFLAKFVAQNDQLQQKYGIDLLKGSKRDGTKE
jgi:hypothetical protein